MFSLLLLALLGSHCCRCDTEGCEEMENINYGEQFYYTNFQDYNCYQNGYNQLIATPAPLQRQSDREPFDPDTIYTIQLFEFDDPTVPIQVEKLIFRNVSNV